MLSFCIDFILGVIETFINPYMQNHLTNPIEKFNVKKSYDYINEVILNRLEDKQKEEIKKQREI